MFTINKFLLSWAAFNLFFLFADDKFHMFEGIYAWVNIGFIILTLWMLFGLYLAFKRGAIYKDPYTGKTIYKGPTKTTEL